MIGASLRVAQDDEVLVGLGLRVLGEEGVVAGVVADAAIFFVFLKIADADFG